MILWTYQSGDLEATVTRLNDSDAQLLVKQAGEIKHDSTTKLTNGKSSGIALADVTQWQQIINELQ